MSGANGAATVGLLARLCLPCAEDLLTVEALALAGLVETDVLQL